MNHYFTKRIKALTCIPLSLCILSACAQTTSSTWNQPHPEQSTIIASPTQAEQKQTKPVEVAFLVPLSGKGSELGQSLLNAAQLALFDMNPQNFQLIPKDTKGNPIDAQIATQEAINNGADVILGPLFSDSVKSAAAAASPYNINVIGFTTDKNAVSYNGLAMGFLPDTQVQQILRYAMKQQIQRLSVVTPQNAYGQLVATTVRETFSQAGYTPPHIHTIKSNSQLDLDRLYSNLSSNQSQAILLAVDITTATAISSHLVSNGLPNNQVQRLGLGLWDDRQRAYSSALEGAWFAAPSPIKRDRFTRLYKNTYGVTPPRLASMGYDSAALAISLAKYGNDYSRESLTRQNGFYGLDGIFRFRSGGLVERGLAILEFSRGRTVIRESAPQEFM